MRKKIKLFALCCLCTAVFAGCQRGFYFSHNGNIYTEENMSHFSSDKVKIDPITAIDVTSTYADFDIIASDDYYIEYSYYYITNEPVYKIEDGKLTFDDGHINNGNYSINLRKENYLKIYVPTTAQFDTVTIDKSTGDCSIGGFTAGKMSVMNSYGNVVVSSCAVDDLRIDSSSGDASIEKSKISSAVLIQSYGKLVLKNINQADENQEQQSKQKFDIDMSSGVLDVDRLKTDDFKFNNAYGDVSLEEITADSIDGTMSSGKFVIDDGTVNDMDLTNSYGNVKIDMNGALEDYVIDVKNSYGDTEINGTDYDKSIFIDHGGSKKLKLNVSSGNVDVTIK